MIGAQALLVAARSLTVPPTPNKAAVTHVVTGLRSRRVPQKGGASRLRYPGRPADLDGVATALEDARQRTADEFAMLSETLRDPLRGYPMITDDQSERHKLVGSWSLADGAVAVGFAEVTVRPSASPADRLTVAFDVLKDPPLETVVSRMEDLFSEIVPGHRLGDRHRDPKDVILWVGDSGRAGAAGGGWKDKIAAVTEARGLGVTVSGQPTAFQRTHTEIARYDGRAVAIWTSSAGPFTARDALPPKWRALAISLDEPDFEDSLDELRLSLDEGVSEPPPVESWQQFRDRVSDLESEAFVLTERCRDSLPNNPYPDPERMWDFTERLSRAARDRRELGGELGDRLADWVAENYHLEIALHDSNLGAWADFSFEGRSYSREPHVKVDDFKDPSECGRIYFAIDKEAGRFIVDHIGLHP